MLSLIIKVAVVSALVLTVSSEEVDVVEAVPGSEVPSDLVGSSSNQAPVAAAQNREDPNEGGGSVGGGGGGGSVGPGGEGEGGSDQLALESTGDQEAAASGVVPATATAAKHTYVPAPPSAQPQQGPPPRHALRNPPQHKPYKQNQGFTYHGPPPPPPPQHQPQHQPQHSPQHQQPPQQQPPQQQLAQASEKQYGVSAPGSSLAINGVGGGEEWPVTSPDTPKIVSLDVKCEKSAMKVFLSFDKPFYGIVFSKGHFSNVNCVHLPAGLGRTSANFEISIHACGTAGNTENGLYGYGADSGSGTYFENIIVIQYDPQVQEVWDQARKLRCTWHDQYEKSVTFRPFPVDMLDVVRADFAGDNVGCWMQIQMGKGPWASEVSGLVKIGQTMTMVLAIKDDDSKFDMLVRNCMAHDGKRAPIQLVDHQGCVTRPKLMSRFNKIKNFGASASVLSYAHFQAFKFPDSMEVHFQCTIQICRHQCPDQCSANTGVGHIHGHVQAHPYLAAGYGAPALGGQSHGLEAYLSASTKNTVIVPPPPGHGPAAGRPRDERRVRRHRRESEPGKEVGLNRIIRVVSTGDLTFPLDDADAPTTTQSTVTATLAEDGLICMTTPGFAAALVVLLGILFVSCLVSALLCLRLRIRPGKQAVRVPPPMTAPAFVAVQTLPAKRPNAVFYS